MNLWERLRKTIINTKNRTYFAVRTVFSSRKSLYRWTLGINVAALLLAFMVRHDQLNQILTKQIEWLSNIEIPVFLRSPIYSLYSKHYQVNTKQIELPLKAYPTLSSFFIRKILRQQVQPKENIIASPCDGKILSFSQVKEDSCHLIKGLRYSLSQLVFADLINLNGEPVQSFLKKHSSNKLYQIVLYLAPGDYHRFHSPTDIKILKKLSIPGRCDPVNQKFLLNQGSRYEKNGRISLFCEWKNGLLTMSLVGALNVTKIHVNDLVSLRYGQQLGYFNLGSTIVMIVESKQIKDWKINLGDKVKYGDPLFEYVQ